MKATITTTGPFVVKSAGEHITINTDRLHPDTLEAALAYGLSRLFYDAVNSRDKDKVSATDANEARLQAFYEGTVNVGTGGGSLSPVEIQLRLLLVDRLVSRGEAKGDAQKAVKSAKAREALFSPEQLAGATKRAQAIVALASEDWEADVEVETAPTAPTA